MPWMNFDLQDGKPPIGFDLKPDHCERFMEFLAECQALKESAVAGTSDPVARHLAAGIADHWRDGLLAALPFVRHYAEKNPRRLYKGEWQDPSGVHAWLARYDPKAAKTPCGECHLMPGERCDICGVTAPDNL